jgi:DNA (cytosine-5)-methyltransferase 1
VVPFPRGHGSNNHGLLQRGCFWSDAIWHQCRDGKQRRISPERGVFPLAPRIPGRVLLLKGYGNSIVPPLAADFIRAYTEL